VQQDRVLDFWRDPHAAARAMLLKVHLVGGPKIDAVVLHQGFEFFYVLLYGGIDFAKHCCLPWACVKLYRCRLGVSDS
jgi:hypothetical protein